MPPDDMEAMKRFRDELGGDSGVIATTARPALRTLRTRHGVQRLRPPDVTGCGALI